MAIIPKKTPWTRKPALPKINRSHWFGKHIQSSLLPNLNIREFDVARNKRWSEEGTPVYSYDSVNLNAASDNLTQTLPLAEWTEATIFLRVKLNSWSNGKRVISFWYTDGVDDIRILTAGTTDIVIAWDDGSPTNSTFSTVGSAGDEFIIVMSHDGGTQRTWIYNVTDRVLSNISTSNTFTFSGADGVFDIGSNSTDNYDFKYLHVADRAVKNTAQALDLIHNEYAILQPQTRYLFTAAAAGQTGALLAGATSAGTFGATASASAAITEGSTAGDTPGGAAAAQAALLAGSTAADIQAALTAAQAAITEGATAGETWVADATALASILEAALAGETFTSTTAGADTGSITEGSTSQAAFASAVQTVASITAGAVAAESLTALLQTTASLTEGAIAGASFDIAGEIGNLIATITIQAAIGGAILIGKAIDGDVTIN
jgi:hypothetical protein